MKKYLILFSILLISSCTHNKSYEKKHNLNNFKDRHYGISFSHTPTLSVSYNPYVSTNRIKILHDGIAIGVLTILRTPPMETLGDFIISMKKHFKAAYNASSVNYKLYKNSNNYEFQYIKAENIKNIVESYIYIPEPIWNSPNKLNLNPTSGAFSFEILYSKNNYQKLKTEIKTIIDSFRLSNINLTEKKSLVGIWRDTSTGKKGIFEFNHDGHADVILEGKSLPRTVAPNIQNFMYTTNTSKYPMEIDYIGFSNSGNNIWCMKMIYEYISKNKIRIRTNFNNIRPTNFISGTKKDTLILIKQD